MRNLSIITLMLLVSGCLNANDSAVCSGLSGPINDLVEVVVLEGTDAVVLATEGLVVKFDAGCG